MKSFSKEELIGKVFLGEVLDANDPDKEGRCKIKIFGLFNSEDPVIENGKPTGQVTIVEMPIDQIPWASPANGKTFAGGETKGFGDISIPKIGTVVKVTFPTGDLYSPEWTFIQNLNVQAIEEIQDSYEGSHILLYDNDEQVKVFYTPGKGLNIFHKDSSIIINPDSSITIQHKDTESIIELIGNTINVVSTQQVNVTTEKAVIDASTIELGEGATESVIKGDAFKKLFDAHTHPAVGAPPTIPLPSGVLSKTTKTK
jgi:hypothetical protein